MSERYVATMIWLSTCAGVFAVVTFVREVILG